MNEHENPWTTLSSKPIYENPWLSLREDQVINPKGGRGIYGVVDFKNMAIGVVPIDADGNTYLVGQYRYPLNEYSWEIPEGGGPHGIDALESAKRELKEETGFTAGSWTDLGRIHTSNSVTSEFGFLFLAQDLTAGETEHEETEELHIKKVPLTEAVRMVMAGEITDALSIAGILKADKILNHPQ
ncbi:NUDIX domain-containing protein [Adhaeribacter radiodurans]|uniref:GDP-mannose pyrophosphatase n=1 Tax=Adhaeribacter radiodurans TaxID=2745197 RepID=A0A7L7LBJ0_9BACT|nr:NUDIX hydrolase [Adhaeribacter radiodurans]QMU30074.1 NUDIX hydrolase [Adhaeribacter radiodurans]